MAAELRFGAARANGTRGGVEPLEDGGAVSASGCGTAAPRRWPSALLHSYARPAHEQKLAELLAAAARAGAVALQRAGGTFREYERTATTALDAALSPPLAAYLSELLRAGAEAGAVRAADHAVLGWADRARCGQAPTLP